MSPTRVSSALGPAERRVLSDDVTSQLRDAIVTGVFEPGSRLGEGELASSMNVSRGPIREALARLSREGLVVLEPFKGARVAELYRDDIDELFSLRTSLEQLAVEWACSHADDEDLAELDEILARFDKGSRKSKTPDVIAELDFEFHDRLVKAAHHQRLYRAWEGIRAQVSSFLITRLALRLDYQEEWSAAHRELLTHIRNKDSKKAVDHASFHIRASYERVVQAMEHRE